MPHEVPPHCSVCRALCRAHAARVGFVARVRGHVNVSIPRRPETFTAVGALVRAFPGVREPVRLQIPRTDEPLAAEVTLVRFYVVVPHQMPLHALFPREHLLTDGALEQTVATVKLQVPFQICSSGERLLTYWTYQVISTRDRLVLVETFLTPK